MYLEIYGWFISFSNFYTLGNYVDKSSPTVIIMKVTNKMHLYRLIYFSLSALHVSGDVFPHYQEHLTVFTVSGSVHCNSKIIITSNY